MKHGNVANPSARATPRFSIKQATRIQNRLVAGPVEQSPRSPLRACPLQYQNLWKKTRCTSSHMIQSEIRTTGHLILMLYSTFIILCSYSSILFNLSKYYNLLPQNSAEVRLVTPTTTTERRSLQADWRNILEIFCNFQLQYVLICTYGMLGCIANYVKALLASMLRRIDSREAQWWDSWTWMPFIAAWGSPSWDLHPSLAKHPEEEGQSDVHHRLRKHLASCNLVKQIEATQRVSFRLSNTRRWWESSCTVCSDHNMAIALVVKVEHGPVLFGKLPNELDGFLDAGRNIGAWTGVSEKESSLASICRNGAFSRNGERPKLFWTVAIAASLSRKLHFTHFLRCLEGFAQELRCGVEGH